MSPTVLNARLSELREVRLVEIGPDGGYVLTVAGKALLDAMLPLMNWASDWERELAEPD